MEVDSLAATLVSYGLDPDRSPDESLRTVAWLGPTQVSWRPSAASPDTLERPPPDARELPAIDVLVAGDASVGELAELRVLGEGGAGRVVLAKQRSLRRRVAVKTAHDRADTTRAIVHEGVVTGMLEHPNIPPVHGLGRDAHGRAVLVMKNIEGVTWADVLRDPAHPLRATSPLFAGDPLIGHLEILMQLCNALAFAHARGVVHRDIKPANVMLGAFGEVYLIDWGVAFHAEWHRESPQKLVVGTPVYIAPEMVGGEIPDARTDVYLLGATLHEVLTGAPPHRATSLHGALRRAIESAPPSYGPDVPPDLAALCVRAMRRDRAERWPSAEAFRAALREHLSHRSSSTLCDAALARLESLQMELQSGGRDAVTLVRLQHECRFGFTQALQAWPGNAAARDGLARTCEVLAEHELAQGNARGARALLAEMPVPAPALEAAIRALEDRQRAQAEFAQQVDARNVLRERVGLTLAFAAMVGGLVIYRVLRPVDESALVDRHDGLLIVGLVTTAIIVAILVALRRRLFGDPLGRAWATLLVALMFGAIVNRAVGRIFLPGSAVTLAGDLVAGAVAAVATAPLLVRSFRWIAVPLLLGIGAICALPSHATLVYNVAVVVCVALAAGLMRHAAAVRARAEGEVPGSARPAGAARSSAEASVRPSDP